MSKRQRLADGNTCFECGKVTVTNKISACLCFEENGVNGHGVRICNMPQMSRSRHHSPLFDLLDDALRFRLWYTHVLQLLCCMLHFLYQYEVCPWLGPPGKFVFFSKNGKFHKNQINSKTFFFLVRFEKVRSSSNKMFELFL
jgi:hypothetical protein